MTFTNEGMWDRVIRTLLAVALGYAAWITWPGTAAMVFAVIAAIALVTGLVGWCPAYALFHFSSKKKAVRA
jgi:hypothetical protein